MNEVKIQGVGQYYGQNVIVTDYVLVTGCANTIIFTDTKPIGTSKVVDGLTISGVGCRIENIYLEPTVEIDISGVDNKIQGFIHKGISIQNKGINNINVTTITNHKRETNKDAICLMALCELLTKDFRTYLYSDDFEVMDIDSVSLSKARTKMKKIEQNQSFNTRAFQLFHVLLGKKCEVTYDSVLYVVRTLFSAVGVYDLNVYDLLDLYKGLESIERAKIMYALFSFYYVTMIKK